MKIKILFICFTLSFLINIALSIHLLRREPVCGHVHWDEIDRKRDVIPDEKTAVRMAREKLMDDWLMDDYPYEYHVFYNEPSYEWIVFIQLREEDKYRFWDAEHVIGLRRDYG